MSVAQVDHQHGFHKDEYKPAICPDCWPNGAPATVAASIAPPATQPVLTTRSTSSGMEHIGSAIERLRVKFPRLATADPSVLDEPPPPPDGGPLCDTCKGFRWVRRELEPTDPEFGKPIRCPVCERGFLLQRRLEALWGGLPDLFRDWTMDSFQALSDAHAQLGAEVMGEWLDDSKAPWLFAWGESSRGKTGLAVALMHQYTLRGGTTLLRVVPDVLEKLRQSYSSKAAFEEDGNPWLASLYAVDLLVLDDLGSEYHKGPEDWAAEKVFQVIGGRHDRRMRTIITSNYSLTNLRDRLGHARTPSRIGELATDRWILHMSDLPNVRNHKTGA